MTLLIFTQADDGEVSAESLLAAVRQTQTMSTQAPDFGGVQKIIFADAPLADCDYVQRERRLAVHSNKIARARACV